MTKVAVCTPTCGPPSWHYVDSMLAWQSWHYQNRPDIEVEYIRPSRILPIDVGRNLLVRLTLQTDADYLWFLDQDAAWLPQTLDRLMSWDLPIVSALEMMRLPTCCYPMALKGQRDDGAYRVSAPEVYAYIGRHHDYESNQPQILPTAPPGSLLDVRFTGCHCLLIRRDVLAAMEEPWFKGYAPGGEDQYFCEKAADDLGIKTLVDMSVLVGHATTDRIIGAFDFMSGFKFENDLEEGRKKEAAMLAEAVPVGAE